MTKTSERRQTWRERTKWRLVDALGGKCRICGYDKCRRSLHFHHVDPSTKTISISKMTTNPRNIEAIAEEAKKCILVCSNCHGEIHEGLLDVSNIEITFDESKLQIKIKIDPVSIACLNCGKQTFNRKYCSRKCIGYGKFTVNWPDPDVVLQMVKDTSYVSTAEALGCSDVGVKKFLIRNNKL